MEQWKEGFMIFLSPDKFTNLVSWVVKTSLHGLVNDSFVNFFITKYGWMTLVPPHTSKSQLTAPQCRQLVADIWKSAGGCLYFGADSWNTMSLIFAIPMPVQCKFLHNIQLGLLMSGGFTPPGKLSLTGWPALGLLMVTGSRVPETWFLDGTVTGSWGGVEAPHANILHLNTLNLHFDLLSIILGWVSRVGFWLPRVRPWIFFGQIKNFWGCQLIFGRIFGWSMCVGGGVKLFFYIKNGGVGLEQGKHTPRSISESMVF